MRRQLSCQTVGLMSPIIWVLESIVFPESHPPLREAIDRAGYRVVDWSDDWSNSPAWLSSGPTIFHGSLGNAALVHQKFNWTPGSFCDTDKFCCSSWYAHKQQWLIHEKYRFTTVAQLVENATDIAESVGAADALFVRPDSPLKPFSGRVVNVAGLTPTDLDYGFYYDDLQLPVVVAPVRNVGHEWRFVVVNGSVIAGSGYDAATRTAVSLKLDDTVADFAASIAAETFAPCSVYVLDVCDCDGELRLMEFNPFGGADLYACKPDVIVDSLSRFAEASFERKRGLQTKL